MKKPTDFELLLAQEITNLIDLLSKVLLEQTNFGVSGKEKPVK